MPMAKKNGAISARLIDEDNALSSYATIAQYFGLLLAAYRLAGLVRLAGKPVRYGLPTHESRNKSKSQV